jgi:hypothetical protein
VKRGGPLQRRSRIGETSIRQLKPGEPMPDGEPRRYTSDSRGYVRLRWKVGKGEYVETYEHRLVAGIPDADVHHRDGRKGNNDSGNLSPLSKTEHAREHGAQSAARSRRATEWGGARSQGAYDKKRQAAARREERKKFLDQVAELYGAGMTTTEIGNAVGRDPSNISRGLRRAGVPPRPKRRHNADVPPETRQVVHARARLRCERDGKDLADGGGHVHHRRPRQSGGSRADDVHSSANLLLLCVACHEWVESNRTIAYEQGLLVHAGANPAAVPVTVTGGRQVLLHPTKPIYLPNPNEGRS